MTVGLPATVPNGKPAAPAAHKGGPGIVGWAKGNPTLALGAAGIAIVVTVAFVSSKTTASSAAAVDPSIDPATGIPYAQETATGSTSGYDSTANDVYNSLAGQLQALQSQVGALTPGASTPTPAPTSPVPTPVVTKPAPTKAVTVMGLPVFNHYDSVKGAIYGVTAHGNTFHLTPSLYKALGSPKPIQK